MEPMVDEKGNKHYITESLGKDGQGTLYATKNSDIILRVADKENEQSNFLLLPFIGESLNSEDLLLPLDILVEPNIGHVINIPEGFAPISTLKNTTGLKRRLGILSELSKILIKLHSIPVMYGSMSPLRVFISPQAASNQVRLLFSSKMNFSMSFAEEKDDDTYISPEAAKGSGSTLASDSYTFGALAYNILIFGIDPQQIASILTPELEQLFERAKGEPAERPKIAEFYKGFLQQLDLMLTCKKCHFDFLYYAESCPSCAAPLPKMLKASIYDKIGNTTVPCGQKILEFATNRQCFYSYHTDNVLLDDKIEPRIDCVLKISGDRKLNMIFKNLMDKEIIINDKPVTKGQATVVPLPSEVINISFKLYSATERCIDMVMV